MRGHPEWDGWSEEINRASASYGLMQLMYPIATQLGFKGEPEELYEPTVNIMLGAKLLNSLLKSFNPIKYAFLTPMSFSLARYNGGSWKNPDKHGVLRTQGYVDKVMREYAKLVEKEEECTDEDED